MRRGKEYRKEKREGGDKSRRELGRLERKSRQKGKGQRFLTGKSRELGMEKSGVGPPAPRTQG